MVLVKGGCLSAGFPPLRKLFLPHRLWKTVSINIHRRSLGLDFSFETLSFGLPPAGRLGYK